MYCIYSVGNDDRERRLRDETKSLPAAVFQNKVLYQVRQENMLRINGILATGICEPMEESSALPDS